MEGGIKPTRKYIHLLLHRMKWEEDVVTDAGGQPVKDAAGQPVRNWCGLVWQGLVSQRMFVGFKLQRFDSVAKARTFMEDKGVPHYYDMVDKFVPSAAGKVDVVSDDDL